LSMLFICFDINKLSRFKKVYGSELPSQCAPKQKNNEEKE